MTNPWQWIPTTVYRQVRLAEQADDWAAQQRARLAEDWATEQRSKLAGFSASADVGTSADAGISTVPTFKPVPLVQIDRPWEREQSNPVGDALGNLGDTLGGVFGVKAGTGPTSVQPEQTRTPGLWSQPSALEQAREVPIDPYFSDPNRQTPGLMDTATQVLGAPQQALFGAIEGVQTGQDPIEQARRRAFGGEKGGQYDPITFNRILENAGVGEGAQLGPVNARDVAGFVGDVALDPLNLIGGGEVLKGGSKLAQAAPKLAREAGPALARGIESARPIARELAGEAGAMKLPGGAAKQPWEMTANEVGALHRDAIEKALQEGQKVPDEVLAEYPDLAAKYADPFTAGPDDAAKLAGQTPIEAAPLGQTPELSPQSVAQLTPSGRSVPATAALGPVTGPPQTLTAKAPGISGASRASSSNAGVGGPPSIVPPGKGFSSTGGNIPSGSAYEDISKWGGLREFWDRSRNVIASQGDAGKEIASRLQAWRDDAEKLAGGLIERMPVTRSLNKTEFANFVDVVEGQAAPTSQKVADAALEWTRTRDTIYQIADNLGAVVGYRPDYFPHIYDEKMFKGDRLNKAVDHLIKTGQAKDSADAMRKINDFKAYVRADRRHGNLENPRTLDLPDYEKTPKALFGYIESATNRLAQVKNLGKRDEEIERLIGQIADDGGASSTVQHLFDIAVGKEKYGEKVEAISRKARTFNVVTKMGLGAISNASQSVNTATVSGALRTAMAAPKAAFNKEAKDFALKAGVTLDGVVKDLREGAGWSGKLGEVATPGFNQVEKFNRTLAAWSGKGYAESLAKELAANKNVKRATAELTKMGIDPQAVLRRGGRLTEDEQISAARSIVQRTQFKVDPQDLPGWTASPFGKMVMQFRTFSYNQSAFMAQEVIKPAMEGNIKPLARFLLIGIPVGAAVAETRNLLRYRPSEEDPTKRWLEYFQAIGGIGLVGDLIKGMSPQNANYLPAERYATQALGTFLGPTVSTFAEGVGAAAVATQGKPTSLERFIIKQAPVVGPTIKNIALPYKPGGRSGTTGTAVDNYLKKRSSGNSAVEKYLQRSGR